MSRKLPPLTALRAFEAAGRHLSFTRAAGELHVTQAAVSYQVRALEQHLGVSLFRRLARRVLLTDEGQQLLAAARDAFAVIADTSDRIRAHDEHGTLTVTLRPYFAARWLSPRLGRFFVRHPGIELRLHHSIAPVDFGREDVDMAVRWGSGDWPDVQADLLFRTELTPVCSPALLAAPHRLRTPRDLRYQTLLHEESFELWERWLALAGVGDVDARRGPIIDDSNVRAQAAIDGQGVSLAPVAMMDAELASGRLVAPFDVALTGFAYYVVYPAHMLSRPKVKAFRDWLLEEGAAGDGD